LFGGDKRMTLPSTITNEPMLLFSPRIILIVQTLLSMNGFANVIVS